MLTALVNEYRHSASPVKGARIAEVIDRSPGSIRNQMQAMKSLGLVESVRGPKGGYRPTEQAFAVLDREPRSEPTDVTLSQDFDRVSVTVDEIRFANVDHPNECTAHVHFQRSEHQIAVGDPIVVGPTPHSDLVVGGQVEAVDDTINEILLDVSVMEAPLTDE